MGELPIWSVPTGDGVPVDVIESDRDALVAAIDEAMAFHACVERAGSDANVPVPMNGDL